MVDAPVFSRRYILLLLFGQNLKLHKDKEKQRQKTGSGLELMLCKNNKKITQKWH